MSVGWRSHQFKVRRSGRDPVHGLAARFAFCRGSSRDLGADYSSIVDIESLAHKSGA